MIDDSLKTVIKVWQSSSVKTSQWVDIILIYDSHVTFKNDIYLKDTHGNLPNEGEIVIDTFR